MYLFFFYSFYQKFFKFYFIFRTFVALRHWLLNYFAYDFVPCRNLRSKLITYLNTLHPSAPRDQKIVQALKKVIKRLKKIYYRKGVVGISKNGNGIISGNGTEKKTGDIIPENTQQQNSEQFLEDDVISVEHSGVGAGISLPSSKEKLKKTIKRDSTSTISSILTPGTTDSESEEFGRHRSSRSGISQSTEFRQSFEAASSNSQYSDEFSTDEYQISSFYNEKLAKSLPTLTSKRVGDWELGVDGKGNDKVPKPKQKYEKKLKLRSSSMNDLSQRRKLQAEFKPLKHNSKDNLKNNLKDNDIIIEEEEPPPLPPRRHRRHTITYTQPTLVVPPSPSFFKGGFLNFPIRKPKTQEAINEKFQDRTRKKRSLSLSEAICGFAENDDDEDEDDEFDLSQIDHAGGIVRRNSSPAYIGSPSIQSDQKEKGEASKRKPRRPSWPQKMSATVGKFAKVLFTPGTGKSGGIKMLCANSEIVTPEEGDSEISVPAENLNEDDLPIYLDGFSYVDESLEEEYYDAMRQEDFAGTEERFNWDEEEEGELQEEFEEEEEEEEEEEGSDDEGLASTSTEPHIPPNHEQEKEDKNEDLEEQENSQSARTTRRKTKVWELGPVLEVEDDDNFDKSSISLHDTLESKKEEEKMAEELSSENKQAEDPQSIRRRRRHAKFYEVKDDEPNIFVTPLEPSENKGEVLEQGLDIEEEDDEENNYSSHRLRRLPKVRDLRSVVTIKDLEEKSGKRVSWSTFSSLGTSGIEDTGTAAGTEAMLSRTLTSSSSSKLKNKESVKSSSDIGTEIQGENETSKEVERELVKRKDKSIMKPPSSEQVANSSSITPGSPKKSSESSVKRIVITEPPSKKLPDIPVQHTTTTTTTSAAEPRGSKVPIKNIPATIQKSSLNKPLPPLPIQDNQHNQPKKPPSISTTVNSQSQYRSFILNYRSEDIAKQFCLIERDFLLKVSWEDLVQVGYTTNEENVQKTDNEEKKEKKKDVKGKGKEKELEEVKEKPRKRVQENGVDKVIERFNLVSIFQI